MDLRWTYAAIQRFTMKPMVTKISAIPSTGLVCCSQCFRLISYDTGDAVVTCHACGTTVKSLDLPTALGSPLRPD